MNQQRAISQKARVWHRYLGFFLAGIMAVYAISGITLIFRDSDLLKQVTVYERSIEPGLNGQELGRALDIRRLRVEKREGDLLYFKEGTYNVTTGAADYRVAKSPFVIDQLQHLHKAKSSEPLFFLNIFFGLALLFFVVSAFWMFAPGSTIFKKGLYFSLAGLVLTLILLFV